MSDIPKEVVSEPTDDDLNDPVGHLPPVEPWMSNGMVYCPKDGAMAYKGKCIHCGEMVDA